jgi:hypothetical protein
MTTIGLLGALGILGAPGPDVTPGTMPAWALVFSEDTAKPNKKPPVTVSSYTYDGSVTATLPAKLAGGRYEVIVEGLSDDDYRLIRLPAGNRLMADLHLWWRDTGSGILADLTRASGAGDLLGQGGETPPANSLVAVIRVDTLRRQAGERRYDTFIAGREVVMARLGQSRVLGGLCYESLDAAARAVARDAGVPVVTYGLKQLTPAANEKSFADVRPGTALEAVEVLQSQAAASLKRQGLSAAVIRDGTLHLGLWTAGDAGTAPLSVRRVLEESGGLLAVTRGTDTGVPEEVSASAAPEVRASVTATCLGRPDIKPGDIVGIPLPPEDFPKLTPAAGAGLPVLSDVAALFGSAPNLTSPSPCIVTGVTHRLSARQGFFTVVQASVLRDEKDDGWDPVPPKREDTEAERHSVRGSLPADQATGAAGAVWSVASAAVRRNRGLDLLVGQVRAHAASQQGDPPDQTSSDVWYSTAPDDGRPAAVRRQHVTPERHGELLQVPVVSPFAFGGYGLVLPRYPGQRLLLADKGGGRDVVDIGGVWEDGIVPPAESGDWWLVLPISVPTADLLPQQEASPPDTGKASHDLIGADGRRLIEVSGLTLRVTDQPTDCATRPDPGDTGAVVLEKVKEGKTTRIVLRDDGSIEITGTGISLDAGTGDITLKAANVKVSVTGTMDVS